jgi:hypothetical protein
MKKNNSSILLCNQVPFLLKSSFFCVMNTQDQQINSLQKFIFKTCKNGTRWQTRRWWTRQWQGRKLTTRTPSPLIDLPQNEKKKTNEQGDKQKNDDHT